MISYINELLVHFPIWLKLFKVCSLYLLKAKCLCEWVFKGFPFMVWLFLFIIFRELQNGEDSKSQRPYLPSNCRMQTYTHLCSGTPLVSSHIFASFKYLELMHLLWTIHQWGFELYGCWDDMAASSFLVAISAGCYAVSLITLVYWSLEEGLMVL